MIAVLQVGLLPCLILLAVVVCRDSQTPVELGDQDLANDSPHLGTRQRADLQESQQGGTQDRREERLKVQLASDERKLGLLVPDKGAFFRENADHSRSVSDADYRVTSVKNTMAAVMAKVESAITKDHTIADNSEEAEDQAAAMEALNREKQQVLKIDSLGTALHQEEEFGIQSGGDAHPGSVIGLTQSQQMESPELSKLDQVIQAALKDPTDENIQLVQKAFRLANEQIDAHKENTLKAIEDKTDAAAKSRVEKSDLVLARKAELEAQEQANSQLEFAKNKARVLRAKARVKRKKAVEAKRKAFEASQIQPSPGKWIIEIHKKPSELVSVKVRGSLLSANLLSSCAATGMSPICDSYDAFDGQCMPVDVDDANWHFSSVPELSAQGIQPSRAFFKWFYSGPLRGGWAIQPDPGNASSVTADINSEGKVVCSPWFKPTAQKFVWKGVMGKRVLVSGAMTNQNIEKTCASHNLKPLCDSYDMAGPCVKISGFGAYTLQLSNPSKMSEEPGFDFGHFTYIYGKDGKTTLNYKSGTRVASGSDANGYTLCGKELRSDEVQTIDYQDYKLRRAQVLGRVNSVNMLKACSGLFNGLGRPVCNNFEAWDGNCMAISPVEPPFSFSNQKDTRRAGIDTDHVAGTLWYNGYNKSSASLNTGCCDPIENARQSNMSTWCVENPGLSPTNKTVTFENYDMKKVRIVGKSDNVAAAMACEAANMSAVCDSGFMFFNQGTCIPFEPMTESKSSWKFSDIKADIFRNLPQALFIDSVLYTGKVLDEDTNLPMNWATEQLSKPLSSEKTYAGLSTICAKRSDAFTTKYNEFTFRGVEVVRVPLPYLKRGNFSSRGKGSSADLLSACGSYSETKPYAPICDSMGKNDGMCVLLGDLEKPEPFKIPEDWEVTKKNQLALRQINANFVEHTSIYTGLENGLMSAFVHGQGSKSKMSLYGLSTLCAPVRKPRDIKIQMQVYDGATLAGAEPQIAIHDMRAVRVSGRMTGGNAFKACQALQPPAYPVCDNPGVKDPFEMNCYPLIHPKVSIMKSQWSKPTSHFIHRALAVQNPILQSAAGPILDIDLSNIFWFTGKAKMPMIYSNGLRPTDGLAGWQRNRYTYCAAKP